MNADEVREKVARIIDPHAFKSWQATYDYGLRIGDSEATAMETAEWAHGKQRSEAFAKAAAVLALLAPSVGDVRLDGLVSRLAAEEPEINEATGNEVVMIRTSDLRALLQSRSATQITHEQGIRWFEETFGVPLGDKPGRIDVERVRASVHRGGEGLGDIAELDKQT